MQTYPEVEEYMKDIGLKYIKNSNDFIAGLAFRTSREYTQSVANELEYRAQGAPTNNKKFYELKNDTLKASIYISAAFDGGVFRHIGNLVIDNKEMFDGDVLDLACDCGIVTCFMAKMYPNIHFTGVDINEKAINCANELAEKLGLNNVDFICSDVYDLNLNKEFAAVTSFRALLDVCEKETKPVSFVGYRKDREAAYAEAFSKIAGIASKHLKNGGHTISVERYTAEYGWIGFMQALTNENIIPNNSSTLMRAMDISNTKEYSVTIAQKDIDADKNESYVYDLFDEVMSKGFKSGTGYDGSMAEFAFYFDHEGQMDITDVYKGKRIIHEYAFATAKSGKRMFFESDNTSKKLKYYNLKKEDQMQADYQRKLGLYDTEKYDFKTFSV